MPLIYIYVLLYTYYLIFYISVVSMVKGANFSTPLSKHNNKNLIPLDLEFLTTVNLKRLLILDPNKTNIRSSYFCDLTITDD